MKVDRTSFTALPIPHGPFPQVFPSTDEAGLSNRSVQPIGDRF